MPRIPITPGRARLLRLHGAGNDFRQKIVELADRLLEQYAAAKIDAAPAEIIAEGIEGLRALQAERLKTPTNDV